MSQAPKTVADSAVTLSVLMGPQDTNSLGNVHGGVIMKHVDEAGALAAMRHAGRPAVTVAVDSMSFMRPISVGMLVTFVAHLTFVGRTSMEARVEVVAENPIEGTSFVSNIAYLVFVALDENGRPTPVAPLVFETEEQLLRAEAAIERQAHRKRQQSQETH